MGACRASADASAPLSAACVRERERAGWWYLDVAGARVADGPEVQDAVEGGVHARGLEERHRGVRARQVHCDLRHTHRPPVTHTQLHPPVTHTQLHREGGGSER
eukprot:837556-Rhodomonas_salina.1